MGHVCASRCACETLPCATTECAPVAHGLESITTPESVSEIETAFFIHSARAQTPSAKGVRTPPVAYFFGQILPIRNLRPQCRVYESDYAEVKRDVSGLILICVDEIFFLVLVNIKSDKSLTGRHFGTPRLVVLARLRCPPHVASATSAASVIGRSRAFRKSSRTGELVVSGILTYSAYSAYSAPTDVLYCGSAGLTCSHVARK